MPFRCAGNALELAVPKALLGLGADAFTFDFQWADNPTGLKDPISLCTSGDTAPDRLPLPRRRPASPAPRDEHNRQPCRRCARRG